MGWRFHLGDRFSFRAADKVTASKARAVCRVFRWPAARHLRQWLCDPKRAGGVLAKGSKAKELPTRWAWAIEIQGAHGIPRIQVR